MLNALKISKHLLILCLCIAGIESCYAAVFGINNNTDSELRNAINSANANGAGTDTINFFNKGTVTLSSALPNITSSLYIQGLRANLSIIRAASTPGSSGYRVFNVTANVTVTINDVSIANGYITSGNGAGIATTTGDLYINDCMFIDNRALGSSNTGGAIDAQGNLYVTRSSFINNRHATNGGAVGWHPGSSKTAEFTNVTFSGNIGSSSQANHGGGAFSAFSFSGTHTLKFINCTFKDNVLNGSTPNNGKSIFVAAIGSTFNTTLLNSVLADAATGNYATYLQSGGSVPLSRTYTVASDASMAAAGAGNVNSAGAIGIDTLDFHGGTTRLYSILETSILVDAGTSTGTPDEDQRRVPKSGNKDIGSFEYFEQACDTPVFASTYVRDYANRLYTFTNVNINSAGNVAFVNPGQNVNITFNYSISQNGGFCPGCVVQMYWGIAGYYGICERSFGGYCNCSGSVNRTFTAPNQAGIYYFTTGGSLQFSCQPNPQNFLSASATVAFGAIIVGTPVNGSLVSITGQNESCFTGNDSLFTNAVVGYTCTGVNLTSFEWFKDSVAIPASNVENLPIYDEGVYHVRWFNNINESVFSDTFVVNSIVRGFNSPTALGLSIVDDTLNIQGDTAQVLLLNTQLGAKYVLVDTSSGTAYTDTLNGNGGSLSFNFVPVQGVDFGFFATRQGCSKVLDSTFQIYFNTPPLNGTYTIGQDTSFDYSSINSAISDAYLKGVSGDVIFTIDSGTYNEQFIIHGDSIVGLAEERSITFIPVAGAEGMVLVSDTASGMADNYVLQLNKAHHLNFHGIRFKANNNSFGRVVDFEGANYSIEFTHNVFEGVTATGSSFNTGLLIADGGGGIRLDSFLIYGNTFIKGNYGFLLRDNSGFTYLNNTIDSNRFVDFGYAGVFIQGNRNLVLENNYFNDRGGSSLIYSIYLGNNDRTTVRNNRIINQSSSAAYGVYTVNMLAGAGVPSVIANNSISLINSNGGTTRGIHAQNNRNTQVYNNSIYNNCPSAVNGRGIYFTGPGAYTGNIFKNNNIVFDGPGACFEATSFSTGGIDDIQNNNYYTNGSTLGIWNGVARANLTAWLSATGDDSGSVSFDPYYTSDTLLLPTGLYFNDKGQTVLSELVDIQGLSRDSTTCDIGAYEYSPPFPPGEYVYELGAGNAVELDGVNDYLDMSITNLPQGNAPRSLEVWMRMDGSPSAVSTLFNWGAPVNNQRSGLKVQPDGTVQFVANGFANDVFGTEVVTDGRWHHIAAVYDGTWVSLYIDGVLDVDALRNLNTTGTTLRVGEIVGSSGVAYEGGIDEVRIWDKALTQSELREYMCQRLSRNHPSIDNLITYITFDEGSGDKILDIAQGVTGTFSNVDTTSLWRKSGASLGDSSVYFYDDLNMSWIGETSLGPMPAPAPAELTSINLNLSFGNKDSLQLTGFTGDIPLGLHLYYVNGVPATTGFPKTEMDSVKFWGTYLIDPGSRSFNARLFYDQNAQLSSYKPHALVGLTRANGADSVWSYDPNLIGSGQSPNYVEVKLSAQNNEFWFGELDNSPPYAGPGSAFDFDGVNDQISIASDSDFYFSNGEMSISLMLKRDAQNADDVVLGRWNGSPFHFVFGFQYDGATDGLFRLRTSAGYQNVNFNSGGISNQWEHYTITAKEGQQVKIYRNGVLIQTQNITGTFNQTGSSHTTLGAMGDGSKFFKGEMNQVSFWKKELSEAEVRLLMGIQIDTSDLDLVAYYPLNHPSGTDTAYDISSKGHHGVVQNADLFQVWGQGSDTFDFLISEDRQVGDTLLQLPAFDLDGDSLSYVIVAGNDNAAFALQSNGALTLNLKEFYDFELDSIMEITYAISDGILDDTATLVLNLQDANDPPMLSFGGSIQFDGIDDFADLGTGINLTNKDFSIAFYARTNQPSNSSLFQTFIGQGGIGTRTGLHYSYENAVQLKHGFYNDDLTLPLKLDDNWHHFAFTFNATSKEQRTFVDGELLGSRIAGGNYIGTGNFYMARAPWGVYLDGEMDELQVYERTLSEEELMQNVGKLLTGNEANLIAYHRFNEPGGNTFLDRAGNNDAVIVNAANPRNSHDTILYFISENRLDFDTIAHLPGEDQDKNDTLTFRALSGDTFQIRVLSSGAIISLGLDYETDSLLDFVAEVRDLEGLRDTANVRIKLKNVVEKVYAGMGNGIVMDGINDYIELADSANYLNNLTIEAWVRPNAKGTINSFFGNKASGAAQGLSFYCNTWNTGDGKLILESYNGASYGLNSEAGLIETGKWQHVAVTVSDTTAKLYHNGKLVSNTTGNIGPGLAASSGAWRIGAFNDNAFHLNGSIDEVRIWNTTRSEEEIAAWYNKRIDSSEAQNSLKAYYNFDQEDGDTRLTDISGNEFHGTLRNMGGDEWYDYPDTLIWEVSENLLKNDTLGWAIALDVDDSPLTFTKLSGDNSIFDLDPNSGLVRLMNSGVLDYESLDTLRFMAFEVSESGDGSRDTAVFGIRILDANDPPIAGLNQAAVFDGINDYISLSADNRFKPTNELSLELWVNPDNWIRNQSFFSSTQASGIGLYTTAAGFLNGLVRRNNTYAHLRDSIRIQDLEGWHHLALTYDGRYTRMYLDGELLDEDDAGASYPVQYVTNHTVIAAEASGGGTPEGGWYFEGKLDEIKLWKKAKTATEIKAEYSALVSRVDTNLLLYMNFEQGRENAGINLAPLAAYDVINFTNDLRDTSFIPFTLSASDKWENGDTVGYFPAFDMEDDSLKFYLLNASPQAGVFALDSLSGRLQIIDDSQLNYYLDSLYTFDVRVKETGTNRLDTAALHVKIFTVNEAPYFNSTASNVSSCGGSISDTTSIVVLDVDVPDSIASLSFVGISQDTSLLANSNIFFQASGDSTLAIWMQPNFTTVDDTVQVTIVALDTEGLSDTSSFSLIVKANLSVLSDTIAAPLCFGDSNAYVALLVQDGLSPFVYSWSNGSNNDTLLNVASGSYTVTVEDANACQDSASFTVTDPALLIASVVSITNPSCFQYTDGIAVANASGGVGSYNFTWSDPSSQNSDTASGLSQGSFIVSVSDIHGCLDTALAVLVDPAKVPASFTMSDSAICIGEQASLTANAGSGLSYRWKRNAAFIPGLTGQSILVENGGVYSVEVRDSNNCFSTSARDTLVVHNLPAVSLSALNDACNQAGDSVNLNGGLPLGGSYTSLTPGAVSNGSFIPALAGTGNHVIVYSFTDANSCTNTDSADLFVHPKPALSFSLASSFCIGDTAVELNGGSANHNGNGLYYGTGVNNSFFDPNVASAGSHTIYFAFVDTNSCRDTASFVTTVHAKPVLSHSALGELCIGDNPLSLSGGSATPVGGNANYSGRGVIASSFYPDTAGVGQHFVVYAYTDPNGCSDSLTRSIRVNALPSVSVSPASYCAIPNDTIGLNLGNPTGGSYSGIGVAAQNAFVPALAGVGTHNLSYIYTNQKGCTDSSTASITVNALPVPSFSAAFTAVCASEDSVSIGLGLPQSGGTGVYAGPGVVGTKIVPALSGSGVIPINYVFTDTNSCIDSVSQNITINALPTVSLSAQGAFCADVDSVVLFGGSPVGGSYSGSGVSNGVFSIDSTLLGVNQINYSYTDANGCTDSAQNTIQVFGLPQVSFNLGVTTMCIDDTSLVLVGANPTGGVYSGPGVSAGNFNPALADTGTHVITYTYTDNNACSNTANQSLTVRPIPSINLNSFGSVCADATPFTLSQGSSSATGTGSYSGPGVNGNQFNPSQAGVGTHSLQFTFTDQTSGCSADTTGLIVVRALPVVSLNLPNLYCVNELPLALTSGSPANGAYSGNGVLNDTLFPQQAGVGSNSISYSFTDVFGCSNVATKVIDIKAVPTISSTSVAPVCEYEPSFSLSPDQIPSVGSYSYSGSGVFNDTLFDPSLAGPGLKTISYTFIDTNQCSNDTSFVIRVNPRPTVSFGNIPSVCENAPAFILRQGSSIGSGGIGWYSGPGVSADSVTFIADTAGSGLHTISYYYLDGNNCIDSSTQTIQVDTVPRPIFTTTIPDFCANSSPFPLTQGSPVPTLSGERSSYSGIGVLNGVFYPQYVSAGNSFNVTYSFTDVNGCSGTIAQTVKVNTLPQLSPGFIPTRCDNEGIDTLNFVSIQSAGIAKTYYSGVGIDPNDSISFDPSIAGQGNHLIGFHLIDTNSCSASTQSYITIYASSQVYFTSPSDICVNEPARVLSGGAPLGGSYSGLGVNNGRFNPAIADTGSHSLKYAYTNVFGCTDSAFASIKVNALPEINLNLPNSYCERLSPYDLTGTSPAGGVYSGIGVFNNKFYTNITSKGSFNLTYTYTDTNACRASKSKVVNVVGNPNVSTTPDTLVCYGDRVRLRAFGGTSYRWSTGAVTSSILVQPKENETYRVSVTDANGCFGNEDIRVLVSPEIIVSSTSKDAECGTSNGAASVQASGGVSPFGFVWSTGAIGDVQTNLRSGLYQVTVTDANRCITVANVPVSDVGSATIGLDSLKHPSCFDSEDGYIKVNLSGANTPFVAEWNNGKLATEISNLRAGKYLLSVRDAENCLSFESFGLVSPEEIGLSVTTQGSNCGSADGIARAQVLAQAPISYAWSNGATADSVSGLAAGTYSLIVSDANACLDSIQFNISDLGGPVVNFDSIIDTECGANAGVLSIQLVDTSLRVLWSTGDTLSHISGLSGGIYQVTVEDTAQCKSLASAQIRNLEPEIGEICMLSVDTSSNTVQVFINPVGQAQVARYAAYRKDISGENLFFAGSTAQSNTIADTNLKQISGPWSYVVEVEDSCGNYSPLSEEHRIIYASAIPLPTGPIRVNWTAYKGFEPLRYKVYRSVNGASFQLVNVVGAFQTNYFDGTYPKEAQSLRYLIAADAPYECNGLDVSFSNKTRNVWDFVTTGVANEDLNSGIRIYPNPSKGSFWFEYQGMQRELNLAVINASGQVVYSSRLQTDASLVREEIDLGKMASGLYQLQVITSQGVSIHKLQVIR